MQFDRPDPTATPPGFMPAGERISASLTTGNDDDAFEKNLVIVHTPGAQDIEDFIEVKKKIAERAPEIEVFLVTNDLPQSSTRKKAARRPSLIFSPHLLRDFQPSR